MKLVIFGLTVTSSWGNGHATIWRGLLSSLAHLGHDVTFFERNVPYYAAHRDLHRSSQYTIALYDAWDAVREAAREAVDRADAAIVTSYCPDALAATELVHASRGPLTVFYDLDTPVTLDALAKSGRVDYVPAHGFADFDLVLSYTGGRALTELLTTLRARAVAPLYGSVDPAIHNRVPPVAHFAADLTYLGTYAPDRQAALEELFLRPARALPQQRFMIGGAQYPGNFPWAQNIWFARHVSPPQHPAFYSSGALTLNITRAAMAAMGYCPSGRLFEAAACGTPVVSDSWQGLDAFFEPGVEIILAHSCDDVVRAMSMSRAELAAIGEAARMRTLHEHTAMHRAKELLGLLAGDIPAVTVERARATGTERI